MRREVAMLATLALLAACGHREVTPVGATVITWTSGSTTSASNITLGKDMGKAVVLDRTLTAQSTSPPGAITLKVHLVTGSVEATTDSPTVPPFLRAPRSFEATLAANDGWAVHGSCEDKGPFLQLPTVASNGELTYRDVLFQRCTVVLTRGEKLRELLQLEVWGDGTIKPTFLAGDVTLE
jgi:hypothetical protein